MLRIQLIAIGNKMPAWVRDGCQHYTKRIHAKCHLELVEIAAIPRHKNHPPQQVAEREAEKICRTIRAGSRVIALERQGEPLSSADLAARMATWMRDRERVALLLGGAEGLAPSLVRQSDEVWSLSALTFAHPLARLILAEQIYRGYAQIENLPYHR